MKNFLNKNQKGTVLFMVISVMMILIIVVMAVVMLCVSMQQKALVNFTNTQAYATGKSMVDLFVERLSDSTNPMADLREELIGTPLPTGGMDGGLDYPGPHGLDNTGSSQTFDVEAKLKQETDALSGKVISPMGSIVDDKLTVKRLSRTNFKVYVKVDDNGSIRTVSREISLNPTFNNGLFITAVISKGSATGMPLTHVYGGYTSTSPSGSFDVQSGARYIGKFYRELPIDIAIGLEPKFFLGYERSSIEVGGVVTEYIVPDYFESKGDITLRGATSITDYTNYTALSVADLAKITQKPYIFSSGKDNGSGSITGGNVILDGNTAKIKIGENGKPIDIFAKKDIKLANCEIWGDLFCNGSVIIGSNVKINGTSYTSGAAFASSGAPPVTPQKIANADYRSVGNVSDNNASVGTNTIMGSEYIDLLTGSPSGTIGSKFVTTPLVNDATKNGTPGTPDDYKWKINSSGVLTGFKPFASYATAKEIKIDLGANDIFITTESDIGQMGNTKIEINYMLLNRKDCGNVYFYTPSGSVIFGSSTQVGVDTAAATQYGTIVQPNAEPSHLFWMVNGGGDMTSQSGAVLKGFMYAPDSKYTLNQGPQINAGSNTFFNHGQMGTNVFDTSAGTAPGIFGSLVANNVFMSSGNGSVYIKPPDNMLNSANNQTLDQYSWKGDIYANN